MKIQEQANFIKAHGRFKLDLLDFIYLLLLIFSFGGLNLAFYYFYKQGGMSMAMLFFIETAFLLFIVLISIKYFKTFSFVAIHTSLPFEANRNRIISYLRWKGLEINYSPNDDSIMITHIISFGLTVMQKEMTLVCMDDKILMNIRPVLGKAIWNSQKENSRYKTDIENFIRRS